MTGLTALNKNDQAIFPYEKKNNTLTNYSYISSTVTYTLSFLPTLLVVIYSVHS